MVLICTASITPFSGDNGSGACDVAWSVEVEEAADGNARSGTAICARVSTNNLSYKRRKRLTNASSIYSPFAQL